MGCGEGPSEGSARRARSEVQADGQSAGGRKAPCPLLSGLVTCGACEAPFLAIGAGRWRCKSHRTGTCTNGSITPRNSKSTHWPASATGF
ncbi:zinc ribbon domain-containing protein [Sphingomonas sp. PAMC 26605]|uniref:zinc ribbon domain-containing protein n=1 Tax=Sphingomonas sp. PAMC 26605 TaxID=1112214 RepID=UPI0012F517D6